MKDAKFPALNLSRTDAISAHHALEPMKNTVLVCGFLVKKIRACVADGTITFDDDKEREYAVKIFEKMGKQCPWYLAEKIRMRRRLKRMNIHCGVDLRHALRVFYHHVVQPEQTKTKDRLTLDLVGRHLPGFFPTPRDLCQQLVEMAEIEEGHTVAEPQAGKGDIADVIAEQYPDVSLTCVEKQRVLVDIRERPATCTRTDISLSLLV